MTLREARRQAAGRRALAQAMRMVAELIQDAQARPLDPCEVLDQLHALQEQLTTVETCVGVSTPTTLFDAD